MVSTISLFIVPVLMIVVLSMLAITARWANRPLGLGLLGVMGVLFGGPSAIVMLGAHGEEPTVPVSLEATSSGERAEGAESFDGEVSGAPKESITRSEGENRPVDLGSSEVEIDPMSVTRSEDVPAWVRQEKKLDGPVHEVVVSSGYHMQTRDRDKKLTEELRKATDEYIAWLVGSDAAPTVVNLDDNYIRRVLKSREHRYQGSREFPSMGIVMHESVAMLRFDRRFREEVQYRWDDAVAKTRLAYTALVGGAVLALLGVIFTYFRLDNATRGFYTGRLQFVSVTAILVLITVGVLAARWIPWM